jgi:type II restriction/modification system DNA methylase subunit YeeA
LENAVKAPHQGELLLKGLFQAMAQGGAFGVEVIDWFNGGLFNDADTLPLTGAEFKQLLALSHLDWSSIEPAIFGTLFERGLDPAKRSQLGAHYTDRDSIMRLIDPVIRAPLLAEWDAVKADIGKDKTKAKAKAQKAFAGFLERLKNFRVLDPACGSGNFLYLALQTLKDLEHQAILEAEALGLPRQFPAVGPEAVHGIELNPYAAELARVTVWIGEIQWMLQHGYNLTKNPILRPLETIEQRDAVLNPDGTEAEWPDADVIIGNPPFLGDKKMVSGLGEEYTKALRACYQGRLPGGADLVCYWFEKARVQIEAGKAQRAGLVSTNSIRGGANRKVLERICESGRIFNAWSDEPWVNEGAAVRVSLICFTHQ